LGEQLVGALVVQTCLTFVDLAQGQSPAMLLTHPAALASNVQIHPVTYSACALARHIWRLADDL
jgi:hypothetical protein